jgi:hypothetical protein
MYRLPYAAGTSTLMPQEPNFQESTLSALACSLVRRHDVSVTRTVLANDNAEAILAPAFL